MISKNYCVYMHKNKINGKVYICITGQLPERRWNNGNGYSKKTNTSSSSITQCCNKKYKCANNYIWKYVD